MQGAYRAQLCVGSSMGYVYNNGFKVITSEVHIYDLL
jgi:hypothetical protein